jgi:hypothetical protein
MKCISCFARSAEIGIPRAAIGASIVIGCSAVFKTLRIFSSGIANFSASSSGVGSRPI